MKSENSTAQIKCTIESAMQFYQSQCIHIANLEFIGCGGNKVRHVEEFVVEDTKFEGQENSSTALELIETTAQIVNSTFLSNRKGLYRKCVTFNQYGCIYNYYYYRYDRFIGGAIIATNSTVDISQSRFKDNEADFGGAIFAEQDSIISMSSNMFVSNSASRYGGVLYSSSSTITIEASGFHNNSARSYGGVLYFSSSTITIEASGFHNNSARSYGGVLYFSSSTITIEASGFHNNSARYYGGVLYSSSSTITIEASEFHNNDASSGGVLYSYSSNITIKEASEFHDNRAGSGGVLYSIYSSTITIEASGFHNNSARYYGGLLYFSSSTITIEASGFHNNSATYDGGVLYSRSSTITIEASEFHNNDASSGGVLYSYSSNITIKEASEFHDNRAGSGGVLYSSSSTFTIEASEFHDNRARSGGVLDSYSSTITIEASEFHNNNASNSGGVLYSRSTIITIASSSFTSNVSPIGAIIHTVSRSVIQHTYGYFLINNNIADRYAVIYLSNSEFIGDDSGNATVTFSNNLGSLVAFNSNITFNGYATFVNNQPSQTVSGDFQEGGAITLFQSNVFFDGECNLEHNHAENGGAIHSTESRLYVNGDVTIAHNTATGNGGGVYLSTSELNCQRESYFELYGNIAVSKGGGLHAIGSSIKAASSFVGLSQNMYNYTGAIIDISRNVAERGGGISLEANAKFYILKYDYMLLYYYANYEDFNTTTFTANSADYGGAIYVDDDTNSGTCTSNTETECFFQVLDLHNSDESPYLMVIQSLSTQSMYFSQNHAIVSGSTLYGGLLDRCAVSPFAEVHNKYPRDFKDRGDGVAYFKNVSTPTNTYYTYNYSLGYDPIFMYMETVQIDTNLSVSSNPVRVCLCFNADQNNTNDCTHQHYTEVKKGQTLKLSVVAVDQNGQPVSATIQTSLQFTESGLAEGQLARNIPAECTNLTFNIVSPHISEHLSLYASDGPCKDAELSRATVQIHFLPCSCPIGLQESGMNSTNCTCDCHSNISQYVDHCDSQSGLLFKKPQSRAWISYINDTDQTGYLVYPNCPSDYCLSNSPPVDLNQPNGADAQCAFDRASLLCGSCQPGFSLSLGSSHCLPCPSYWPALLIAITITAILAGIALVALLLLLNVTVAVGTLNGLIFYANIVYANENILLPFRTRNFITMFISWLNLEIGIDTCYFPEMDAYIKTWLQLAFPAYVILLVVLVIIISSYSTKFSTLIGKKDPVATLAILIQLSYAKLLQICFKSLSVGILEYPDGSSEKLWLPDATVKYLSGNHIPLFIVAVLLLLVGLVYAVLLFSWQWLLYLPRWRIFRWSRNPKIQTFIETYHKPYTPKYRYWTGLLLIIRVVLYLVGATNVSNDPTIALTAINFTVCCIFALKQFFGSRLYRKWPVDVLETFFYLNILSFMTFTWYSLDSPASTRKAAATSVIITLIVLLLIILYHVYTYTSVFSKIYNTKLGRIIDRLFTDGDPKPKPERHWSLPPDDDIHRFNELLDVIDRPVNTYDYKALVKQQEPVKPTQSVVEVHQPRDLAAPDPEEVANSPGAAEAAQVKEKEAVSRV